MRKFLTLVGIVAVLVTAGFFVGCSDDNPSQIIVASEGPNNIQLQLQYEFIRGFVGEQRQLLVTATALNSKNAAVPNVKVDFGIIDPASWKGTIARVDTSTNENGEITANYSVKLSQAGTVRIQARIEDSQVAATTDLSLDIVDDVLDTLYLESSASVLTLRPNTQRTASLTATLVDVDALPVSGMQVHFRLDPPNLGSLDSDTGTTNSAGQVKRTFTTVSSTQPKYGSVNVVAYVGDLEAEVPIQIRPVASPSFIRITPTDTTLHIVGTNRATATFTAVVTDEFGVGVPGTPVRFKLLPFDPDADILFGSLTPMDTTDANGQVQIVFDSRGGNGDLILRAVVLPSGAEGSEEDEDAITAEAIIRVNQISAGETGTLELQVDRESIYADNGITFASLTAVLKDESNQALSGKEIVFTANNNGAAASPIMTDSLGIARTVFQDIGMESGAIVDGQFVRMPCMILAKYDALGLVDTVYVDIRPQEAVDNVVLTAGSSRMNAGSNDSTWVRAECFLNPERTERAPEGTGVDFEINDALLGGFIQTNVPVVGNTGVAATTYIAGTRVGIAELKASVFNDIDQTIVESDPWAITLQPGGPAQIFVAAAPTILQIGEVGQQSTVTATVLDSTNNPIADNSVLVQFATTLGTIDPPATPTDSGRAQVFLRPGVEAGLAEITATVQGPGGPIEAQTAVRFIAGGGSSIELSAAPGQISVAGTGQNSASTLRATVRDANGNLVVVPTMVVFMLITQDDKPEACDINDNDPFFQDTSVTSNGIAVATLNAGLKVGPQLIRAYTLNPDSSTTGVQATLSTVAVIAGPPVAIDIDVNDDGEEAGGGAWAIEVSARVYDQYRNPVADSIPIVFSVEPDIANVTSGFTGNAGMNGTPTSGLAYATMIYNSNNTFDTLTIKAHCRTEQVDSIGGSLIHTLPLQRGVLELNVDPANWMFEMGSPDSCDVRVWGILTDGHQILINNAPILFSSNRARFFYVWRLVPSPAFRAFRAGNDMNAAIRKTGPQNDGVNAGERNADNDERGHAVVWLRGFEYDFFLDPVTLEMTVQIEATVEGYDDVAADPGFLYVTRRQL